MLTLFAIPKSFRGHISVIQRNAIRSWTLLRPRPRLILFGRDEGTAEAAAEIGCEYAPDVLCTEFRTPLIQDVFERARSISQDPLLSYLNSDIILMSDFMKAVERLYSEKKRFLMVGQRWDVDITKPIDFAKGWEEKLREKVQSEGKLHEIWGIDYFVFSRDTGTGMPPFAVGRPAWDNWFIYSARAAGCPVVDATAAMMAVHQNHDYRHVPQGTGSSYSGPEAEHNQKLAGEFESQFTVRDATHRLTSNRIVRNLERSHLIRTLDTLPRLRPALAPLVAAIRLILKVTRPVRSLFRSRKTGVNA